MNLRVITNTNTKGQLVIPKKFRDSIGIDESVPLELFIHNGILQIQVANLRNNMRKLTLLEIADRTQGIFSNKSVSDNLKDKQRQKQEEKSSLNNKKQVW